jgi:3-oxoacyl-[acyl-carrier protein] reductase
MTDGQDPAAAPNASRGVLSGRTVVVLGAREALSRDLIQALVKHGARVVAADWQAEAGVDLAAHLRDDGSQVHFVQTNLDSAASLARLAEAALAQFETIDAVVLEAPVLTTGPVLSLSETDWEAAVSRPLRRALLAAQAFLPTLLEHSAGTLLALFMAEADKGPAPFAAAQTGLAGFMQALSNEIEQSGVRAIALGLAPSTLPAEAARAAIRLLAQPEANGLVMAASLLGASSPEPEDIPGAPGGDRYQNLAEAVALSQQLAALLLDTDSEFDRLPIAARPLARGVFKSQVGSRSQDVLRAVNKLTDQLQRMQVSHSANDTEFQVDYPLLAALLERLLSYYQAIPSETARLTQDNGLLGQVRRHTAERDALIRRFLSVLDAVHA